MKTKTPSLADILEAESKARTVVDNLRKNLAANIASAKNPDITPLSANTCIVRMSTLKKRDVWSPEYYLPSAQADYVLRALEGTASATAMVKRIRSMIEKESVVINSKLHRLNPTTVEFLKDAVKDIPATVWI